MLLRCSSSASFILILKKKNRYFSFSIPFSEFDSHATFNMLCKSSNSLLSKTFSSYHHSDIFFLTNSFYRWRISRFHKSGGPGLEGEGGAGNRSCKSNLLPLIFPFIESFSRPWVIVKKCLIYYQLFSTLCSDHLLTKRTDLNVFIHK